MGAYINTDNFDIRRFAAMSNRTGKAGLRRALRAALGRTLHSAAGKWDQLWEKTEVRVCKPNLPGVSMHTTSGYKF